MITKLAKAKDNWFFKLLSAMVAISFISLFGVTGYISSANQNQTVVKVGKKKISQSEFSYRLQKETNALKNLAGEDFELTDEMRTSLAEGVLKQIIDDAVIDQAMLKYGIYFPKAFVQQVIFQQPEFQNPLNGQFHPDIFKRYLSAAGLSEDEYVATVKRAMGRKVMVTDLVQTFAVPQVLSQAIHKMDNQRKSFRYTVITPEDMKIERNISDEEIRQYFEDFSETFMLPETRDVEVMFVPNSVVLNKYAVNDELAEDYFKQHKKELDQPEKREVQQLVFMDKDTAEKALEAITGGKSFAEAGEAFNAENAKEPTLGVVAQDELAEDLANNAFAMDLGESRILQVADTWQIINIKDIIPAKEAKFEEIKQQIFDTLAEENLYDALRDARADIDDAINGGKTLEETARLMNANVFVLKNVSEDKLVENAPAEISDLLSSLDFNELVFSYGLDEITAAEEFDDGIAVVHIQNITDAHLPEIADIKDKIVALWTIQEKNALSKETADNIMADAEDGSALVVAAKARDLEVFRSEPLNRNESFADLTPAEISELFREDIGNVKMFEHAGNKYIIATPVETVNYADNLTEDALKNVQSRAIVSMLSDMSKAAMDSYAHDFKIKVDYKRTGFSE